jgi:multiple sugar transport system substrate-binding protein
VWKGFHNLGSFFPVAGDDAVSMSSLEGKAAMKKRQHVLLAVGVTASLVGLTACGGGGGGGGAEEGGGTEFTASPSGDLKVWGFENADDVGQARLDYAAAQLKDVKIDLDATAFDAQKFTTSVAGGNVPDVVQMDRRFVPTYAAQDLIMPLDKCFEAHDMDPTTAFYENVIGEVAFEDQYFAVPQFFQPPAIIVNKNVMEEAGVTNEDIDTSDPDRLIAAIEKMYKEDGGNPSVLGFDPVATGQTGLWIEGMGGKIVDDKGVPTLDNPDNIVGIEYLKRITDAQGGFAKLKSFTDSFDVFGENNQYVANQVGAQVNAQWYPNVLSPYVDDISINAVPFLDAEGQPFSLAGGSAFVIPANAKNPDAGCAWMINTVTTDAWLAAGEARKKTRDADGGINTGLFTGSPEADQQIREQYVAPSGNEDFDQVIQTYYDVVDYGVSYAVSPAGQEINTELVNAVTAALLGDKTAEEALKDAQAAAMRAYETVTAG